jgi:hypothetical protein
LNPGDAFRRALGRDLFRKRADRPGERYDTAFGGHSDMRVASIFGSKASSSMITACNSRFAFVMEASSFVIGNEALTSLGPRTLLTPNIEQLARYRDLPDFSGSRPRSTVVADDSKCYERKTKTR